MDLLDPEALELIRRPPRTLDLPPSILINIIECVGK